MSVQQNAPNIAILTTVAVTKYKLVTPTGALCVVSTTRTHLGVTQEDQATVGLAVPVRMSHAGSCKVTAAVAFAVGALLYYDAAGQVGTTSASNTAIGVAMEAASGAGSIVEMMPF